MKENSIRRAVLEGRAALRTGLKEFASRGIPWIIEASGFDYCTIDHEHGAFDLETIADLAGWFHATTVSPIPCSEYPAAVSQSASTPAGSGRAPARIASSAVRSSAEPCTPQRSILPL